MAPGTARSLLLLVVVLLGGCSSSKAPAGQTCALNTDCNSPLSCIFGRCHVGCRETRDCPAGQRCARAGGGNVCLLEEDQHCAAGKPCSDPLRCAIDLRCRNVCVATLDCLPSQICASGHCAEPAEVTPEGTLGSAGDAGPSRMFEPCISDPECGPGLICDKNRCGIERVVPSGGGCANVGERCPAGEFCDGSQGVFLCRPVADGGGSQG